MRKVDLTVAITAHAESVVAGPTMRSAEAAISAAEAEGIRVERLIALDAATDECRAFFLQPAFSLWKIVELQLSDLGLTRNSLVDIAEGRWIAWLDADDLFSENWLAVGTRLLSRAQETDDKIIVHPELNWVFDAHPFVLTNPAQTDPIFTSLNFYFSNYYDSLCITPREAALECLYKRYDTPGGFAFEDWPWNIETMAAGWRHVIGPDTIIFKRRRDSSLVVQSELRRTLIWPIESMAIDCVHKLGRSMPRTVI